MKKLKNNTPDSVIDTVSFDGDVKINPGESVNVSDEVFADMKKRYGFLEEVDVDIAQAVAPNGVNIMDLPEVKEQVDIVAKEYEELGFSPVDNKKNEAKIKVEEKKIIAEEKKFARKSK